MQSLTQLNNYANKPVHFTDERPMVIQFSDNSPATQSVTVNEGQTHIVPIATDIFTLTSADRVNFIIDVSSVPGATVTFVNPLPPLATYEPGLLDGIASINNIVTVAEWNTAKVAIITMPRDWSTNWSYTCMIHYGSSSSKSWTTNVTVTDFNEITQPAPTYYDQDSARILDYYPFITDTENDGSGAYTVQLTANNANAIRTLASTGVGGTSSYNSSTKVLTIVGTRDQVNSHMAGVQYMPGVLFDQAFDFIWTLTNPGSGLQTTVAQAMTCRYTHGVLEHMELDRNYTQNAAGLLFSGANLPQIVENLGESYTITFTLADAIGYLGLGESFASPVGWNAGTRTYTYFGTQAECNAVFAALRFFPNRATFSDTTITYTQQRASTSTPEVTQPFSLLGSAASYLFGGTDSVASEEDVVISGWGMATPNPYWADKFCFIVKTTANNLAWFTKSGWSYIGSSTLHTGIYINRSAPTDLTSYLANLNTIAGVTIGLKPDVNGTIVIEQTIGNDSTTNGTTITGGTSESAFKNINVNNSPEYSLTTTVNYTEDVPTLLTFSIVDVDLVYTNYNVVITQASPTPTTAYNRGRFIRVPKGSAWNAVGAVSTNSSITMTGSKATINGYDVFYVPPSDYTDTITLNYSQTKVDSGITTQQALNVPITFNCTTTVSEYSLTQTYSVAEDFQIPLAYSIIDADTNATSYTLSFRQITPDPTIAANAGHFKSRLTSTGTMIDYGYGNPVSVTRTAAQKNSEQFFFHAHPDYVGTVTLGFSLTKLVGTTTMTIATDAIINITYGPDSAEYIFSIPAAYTEDTVFPITSNVLIGYSPNDSVTTSWTTTYTQVNPSPATNPGKFYRSTGSGTLVNWGAPLTVTGNWTQMMPQQQVSFTPPVDYNGVITLRYDQTMTINGITVTQADNVTASSSGIASAEYTIPSGNITVTGLDHASLSAYTVLDRIGTGILGGEEPTYNLSLTQSNTALGTFGDNINSNGNTSFSTTGSYLVVNANTSSLHFWANGTPGSETLTLNLTRNAIMQGNVEIYPAATLASNVAIQLTVTDPVVGTVYGGGIYFGNVNQGGTNYRLIVQPMTFLANGEWVTNFKGNPLSGFYNTVAIPTTPASNSLTTGYTNTETLYNYSFTAGSPNRGLMPLYNAWGNTYNGYSDWYVPSIDELTLMKTNLPSYLPSRGAQSDIITTNWFSSSILSGQVKTLYSYGGTTYFATYAQNQSWANCRESDGNVLGFTHFIRRIAY